MRRGVVALGLVAIVLASAVRAEGVIAPSPAELRAAKEAYDAGEKAEWDKARKAARTVEDPLLGKLLDWQRFTSYSADFEFAEIDAFIKTAAGWPYRERLMQRAEETMSPAYPDAQVIAWYGARIPRTPEGASRLADALLAKGETGEAVRIVRETWIEGNFGVRQERQFYARFRKYLTKEDHVARLDRLLWSGRYDAAKRMYRRVDAGHRALAEARRMLHELDYGVDAAIARVPDALRDDPGLVYERLRWRRIKDRDDDARALLDNAPKDLVQPWRWWRERAILARRALANGYVSEAYRLAAEHGNLDGADLLDAEWLSGWIALRFLKDDAVAYGHFATLYREANYPISRARGAYWAGRAAEVMEDAERARFWYRAAFRHPTTYYGQLAAAKLPREDTLTLPALPHTDGIVADSFNAHELVRVVRLIDAAEMTDLLRPFIRELTEVGKTPDWLANVAELAMTVGRPDLAILATKKAEIDGVSLIEIGYPLLDGAPAGPVESPLVHAIIRQESAFNNEAISRAGARGLMQLMPRTAQHMAKQSDLPFTRQRLIEDPEYNVQLGQAYLAGLVSDFSGSYVLALAAYNAGPSRAKSWVREYGDPRDTAVDPIDWIEMIPYPETRNYIQRVLENLHVYRQRMSSEQVALTPDVLLRQ